MALVVGSGKGRRGVRSRDTKASRAAPSSAKVTRLRGGRCLHTYAAGTADGLRASSARQEAQAREGFAQPSPRVVLREGRLGRRVVDLRTRAGNQQVDGVAAAGVDRAIGIHIEVVAHRRVRGMESGERYARERDLRGLGGNAAGGR